MKKRNLRTITIATLFLLLAAVSIKAQAPSPQRMSVNIPFKFSVGDRELPAGDYTVKCISQACTGFSIQNSASHETAIVLAKRTLQAGPDQITAQLVFNGYEDRYFLSQVWMAATNIGSEISQPLAEAGFARDNVDRRTITLNAHGR